MPALTHSKVVGSSSAGRVLACPKSVDLVNQAPEALPSAWSREGDALHAAVEHIFLRDCDPEKVIGMTFHEHEIDDDLYAECILPSVQAADRFIGSLPFYVERTMPFPNIPGAFGTGDIVTLTEDGTFEGILDFKFGAGVWVGAEDNTQGKFLCSAGRHAHGPSSGYRVAIMQPRLDGLKETTFTNDDLDVFETELLRALNSRREELNMGDHCKFCPAKLICPAQHRMLADLEKRQLLAAELPDILPKVERLAELAKAAQEMAHDLLMAGTPVKGFKLIEGRELTREFAPDSDAELKKFARRKKISLKTDPKPLTVAEVERRVTKAKKEKFKFPDDDALLAPRRKGKPKLVVEAHPGAGWRGPGDVRTKLAALDANNG